ncbi:MAG: AAA family ATPase [bacterium]
MHAQQLDPRIISVGGGKGGVGKSTLAVNIAYLLAEKGKRVILLDADLGGANSHLLVGIKYPKHTLNDFLSGRIQNMSDAILPTLHPNLGLISGASGILRLADPKFSQKQRIINQLHKLSSDYIFVDVGAGSHANVTDFFAFSNHGIVVVSPDPASLENAYGFMKNYILRKIIRKYAGDKNMRLRIENLSDPSEHGPLSVKQILEKIKENDIEKGREIDNIIKECNPRLIVNKITSNSDIQVGKNFVEVVRKYLNISMIYIGYMINDNQCAEAIKKMIPLARFAAKDGHALACLNSIVDNLSFLET